MVNIVWIYIECGEQGLLNVDMSCEHHVVVVFVLKCIWWQGATVCEMCGKCEHFSHYTVSGATGH